MVLRPGHRKKLGKKRTSKEAVPVIAAGGVTTLDDVRALAALPVAGAIIGRALYDGRINLPEAIQAAREG